MFGTWVVFGVYQYEARNEMKNFIQSNKEKFDITEFKITATNAAEFTIDGADELTYKSIKYDIVTKKESNKSIIFLCIEDKNETNLINTFHSLIEKQHSQSPKSKTLNHLSFSVYDDLRYSIKLDKTTCYILRSYLLPPKNKLNKVLIKIIAPPPQNSYC